MAIILNYTTSVSSQKTIGEIQQMLGANGARSITVEYSDNNVVSGISFMLLLGDMKVHYRLPANWQAVQKVLVKRKADKRHRTDEHAINVCWRIIKDWIAAQMAIVQAEQAALATVFLPYAVANNNRTLADNFTQGLMNKQLQIQ